MFLKAFTFQYGQIRNEYLLKIIFNLWIIYIPVWLDQKLRNLNKDFYRWLSFTFQYGQIRNVDETIERAQFLIIYIPVWLDQKSYF